MQVVILKLDGTEENFDLEPQDPVQKVKELLAEKVGVDTLQFRLVFKGQPMIDEKTLGDQNVAPGDVIHMIGQLRGS